MQNAECKMQNDETLQFCILHSAFCIYLSPMRTGWMATAVVAALAIASLATMTHKTALGPNPVVVELFTSQG
jgi:hypothetical protein